MKKLILLITAATLFSINYAQKNKTKENIRIEYSQDSLVRKVIDVAKIESFYKWAESADTTMILDNTVSWDMASLRTTLENYRNTTYNYSEIINKCRLVAESLRMKNAEMQVATVDEK